MGGEDSKPKETKAPQPDLMEVLINMKMKSKMFHRSADKAIKEKKKYYDMAKKQLKAGNQEGAQMYMELCSQKDQENKQMLRMAVRLETIAVQIKSKQNSVDMVQNLDAITPILEMQSTDLPIEQMYAKLENFNAAYDDLTIKGNILDDGMEKTLGEKGGFKNVDNMMNGLQAEVAMEMGVNPVIDPVQAEKNQTTEANNDFYANLKDI